MSHCHHPVLVLRLTLLLLCFLCAALPLPTTHANCASSMAAVHVDEDKDGNRNLYLTGKTGKTTVLTNIVQKGATWVFAESMVRHGASEFALYCVALTCASVQHHRCPPRLPCGRTTHLMSPTMVTT